MMSQNRLLVDSGFLYELYDRDTRNHERVRAAVERTTAQFIIPCVVLTEAAFLFRRAGGPLHVARFLDAVVAARFQFEPALPEDLLRASRIMRQYAEARLDFVDCCIMALAERLQVTQICTLDRRDFAIFRPAHCDFLELLP